MPTSTTSPLGALPQRFRRRRLLIVGCGDIGQRLLRRLHGHRIQILALARHPQHANTLRALGARVLMGDLDAPATLRRLAGLAHLLLHLAPPCNDDPQWWRDRRTCHLLRSVARRTVPARMVYISTSGIYGDRQGAWTDETALPRPRTPRAHRRADAEHQLRHWGRAFALRSRISLLRVAAIYAPDRASGTPRARLLRRTPVLHRAHDGYVNHIHADDLARACWLAPWRGKPQRAYNCNDNSTHTLGEYLDMAADLYGLPRPPRIPLQEARDTLPLSLLGFMQESRRLRNARIQRELRLQWRYPTTAHGLIAGQQRDLFNG